jgi:hypothetical protein
MIAGVESATYLASLYAVGVVSGGWSGAAHRASMVLPCG